MAIESRRIDAIREIGVEYAKSYWQKKMSQVGENGIEWDRIVGGNSDNVNSKEIDFRLCSRVGESCPAAFFVDM